MKPSGFQTLGSGGNLQWVGNAAKAFASAEGFYGGGEGTRAAIGHALGGSYSVQGSPIKEWFSERGAPYITYPEKAKDEDLDLWYAEDGPKLKELKDKYWVFGHDMTDMADTVNNRVGIDNLSGLSFEKRYEKITDMTIEQLKHFAETGAFKKGLPVWNPDAEGTFESKGIISTPEDAKKQLAHLEEVKENIIESRRMGYLRDKGDLSTLGQLAEVSREENYERTANSVRDFTRINKKIKENITEFKKINAARLSETKKVGRGKAEVLTENAQQANKELEKLERNYDRNLKRIENWKEIMSKGKTLGETENWVDEVMKEQDFLKAGNDWVLQ
jgi:hypothetical protein